MTHSLHRHGTPENLANDFVVFAIAAQTVNAKGSASAFAKFFEIVHKYNPVSCGDMRTGNEFAVGLEKIRAGYQDNSIVHAVFTDKEIVAKILKELAEAELGPSIVVSGILDHVDECCKKAGIKRHTIHHSLGIHGKTEKLPENKVLEISTMCGHGMVAFNLIKQMAEQVKAGKITAEAAARELAAQCHCGIVNPVRGAELLKEMAK
ncbi:MAG: hypothetical protein ACOY9Y_03125 [Bacillota bacterium]